MAALATSTARPPTPWSRNRCAACCCGGVRWTTSMGSSVPRERGRSRWRPTCAHAHCRASPCTRWRTAWSRTMTRYAPPDARHARLWAGWPGGVGSDFIQQQVSGETGAAGSSANREAHRHSAARPGPRTAPGRDARSSQRARYSPCPGRRCLDPTPDARKGEGADQRRGTRWPCSARLRELVVVAAKPGATPGLVSLSLPGSCAGCPRRPGSACRTAGGPLMRAFGCR